ncbi:hypothetical protein J6590_104442, partial [Homalodisca vitripennis]
ETVIRCTMYVGASCGQMIVPVSAGITTQGDIILCRFMWQQLLICPCNRRRVRNAYLP